MINYTFMNILRTRTWRGGKLVLHLLPDLILVVTKFINQRTVLFIKEFHIIESFQVKLQGCVKVKEGLKYRKPGV